MKSAFRLGAYAIVYLSILVLAPHGESQSYQGKELVKAELLADTDAVIPGKPFTPAYQPKLIGTCPPVGKPVRSNGRSR